MKYLKRRWFALSVALFAIACIGGTAFALTAGIRWGKDNANRNFTKKVWMDSTLDVDGAASLGSTLAVAGATTLADLFFSGAIKTPTLTSVALTSPTVTFAAGTNKFIDLTANANLTGIYPTGGAVGQILFIHSGAGSNTMRFDDGTSMTIGANTTLTEGQNDWLYLRCTSADGDEWERMASADN